MNIQELDAYNLDDAVKFNDQLNPALWDRTEHLRDDVRAQLLLIAEDFRESLGIKDLDLKDITISGSNAAYTYTPNSDIDLHLVVDQPEDPVYRELFDAKKAQYNDTHDIKIKGFDVELYVEAADKPPVSQGTYSLLQNDWIQVPRRVKADVDDTATSNKFKSVGHGIERAIKSGDRSKMDRMARKIKRMRQTGLEQHGEFGPENLAFKMLRSQGMLQKLHDARVEAKNQELSLRERKKPNSVFTYGFKHEDLDVDGVMMTRPSNMSSEGIEEDLDADGVMMTRPTNCSSESAGDDGKNDEEILKDFIDFCVKELKIESMPTIKLRRDPQWPVVHKTFGRYINDNHTLEVSWGHRHIMDVLRTVAHELTHKHQHERDGEKMGSTAGETGSPWENEANARAGILMRDYARLHPDYFALGQATELHGNEVNESASGYIPTKKQAKDPRFSMALTKDIRPGQLGKEANKLKLKTDSQGHPQKANPNGLFEQLMLEYQQAKETIQTPVTKDRDSEQYYKFIMAKHKLGRPLTRQEREFVQTHQMFKQKVAESEELDEVRMAPSNLKQFADSPEAEGIQAGFEAELIFRDTVNDDDGDEMEPDYDADERCRSLSQIVEFFEGGEYGYLSPRQRNRLEEELDERYYEWRDEQMFAAWQDDRAELIRDAFLEEQSMTDRVHAMLVDGMELTDAEADRIQAVGAAAPRFNSSKEQDAYGAENPDYKVYLEALEGADEILDEEVESCISSEDRFYDNVLDQFRDDFDIGDDSGFFDDVGLRWMSDVASEYDLDWPYMTGASNGGSRDWDSIADSLSDAIGMEVRVSSGYHQMARRPGIWIVEPDSSLDPDDREDYGLEIVSPPMPLKQALEKLQEVTDWANSNEGNAYTNDSTGLHMGVSIPHKGGNVDYLKLLLFMGDEYVLEQFGRESNTYTRAAMKEIRSRAGSERNATAVLELLKNNLIELAERELVRTTGEGKYTSAHKQGKYIEFRSAGGDWLAEDNAEPGKLENTMMRYAYAMYLAGRPDLERKEYAKKLYKLVANGTDDSTMALFSRYAAGEMNKEELKKQWAEKTLSKEAPGSVGKGNWVLVDNNTGKTVQGQTYHGYTEEEAYERAKAKIGEYMTKTAFDMAYSLHPMETGKWEIYRDDHGQDETLEIIDADRRGEAVNKAAEKYTSVIPFKVRAYYGDEPATPEKELSPRAKLAKRITQKKQQADYSNPEAASDWEAVYVPTGRVVDTLTFADAEQAETWRKTVIQQHDFPNPENLVVRRAGQITDVEPNVAQNFAPQQAKDARGWPMWELYDKMTGHAVHSFANEYETATWAQAIEWLRTMGAEDPNTYDERFAVRPKMASATTNRTSAPATQPTAPAQTASTDNYEIYLRRYGMSGGVNTFRADNDQAAEDYFTNWLDTASGPRQDYGLRRLST